MNTMNNPDISDKRAVLKMNFLVSALIPIDEFNITFNSNLSDKDFDTLGGIVMHHFERLPKVS